MRDESSSKVAQNFGVEATEALESVSKAIRRMIHSVDSRSKMVARETGLTIPQIVILRAIRDLGAVPTNRLSAYADLSAATVITILDKLEAKGLVSRSRSDTDRRIVYSRLTPRGKKMVGTAPPLLSDAFIEAFAGLSAHHRQRLTTALNDVAELLDVADHGSAKRNPISRAAK